MSLEDIVSVNVSLSSAGLSKPGFGTIMVAANVPAAVSTLWGPELVREYTAPSQMLAVTEGFVTSDAAYKEAVQAFGQTPKPRKVKVGRLATAQTQTVELTPVNLTVGFVYSGKVQGLAWTFTVLTGTATAICTGIAAAINALAITGCTATADTTKVSVAATAGLRLDYTEMTGPSYLSFMDVTADPGIAADLTAIALADNDWYMLIVAANSKAIIAAAAAWTEATYKLFTAQTADTDVLSSSTTDVASTLKALSYFRTSPWFNSSLHAGLAIAIAANRSTANPGSDTWALKNLSGVFPSDNLTGTQVAKLKLKNCNYYQTVGNEGRTQLGQVSGGEFIDVVRFLDWLRATMQVNVYNGLISLDKVPNTNEGRSVIQGRVEITLRQGVEVGGFKEGSTSSSVPDESDTTSFDATTRTLSKVTFAGTLANAIHAVEITGSVTN